MNDPRHPDARILVVDDNPANVELLCAILEEAGYTRVDAISDPRRVAGALEDAPPDLLLLDMRMPHLDGEDILLLVEDHFVELAPPVIVLTAQTDEATRERALAAGALDFLTKPFDQVEVLQRIDNILAKHQHSKAQREHARELEAQVAERTAELRERSRRDPLTDLPNRRALILHLVERIARDAPTAVHFVVIDHLEDIVGLHGYPVAEQLMRELGGLLTASAVARDALVGSWGSNEFVILAHQPADEARLADTGRRILRLLDGEHHLDELQLDIGVRVGTSHSGDPFDNAEQLLRHAALALPRPDDEHRTGRYRAELSRALEQRSRLRRALRAAPARGELELHYQPKVCLQRERTCGAEALLRWESPELGRVSPGEFIPLAEETGDILALSDWVLEAALAQIAEWQTDPALDATFTLAVNVSTRQLMQPDFADTLLRRVERAGVAPARLQVEVTESGLMNDIAHAGRQLRALREAGVHAAIDDFGTGYSSLAYLKSLPVSVLKIDRSFVDDITENPQDRRLAETVVAMAHNFDCTVVAEGVETAAQAELLAAIGCEHAQGFHYARPMDAGALAKFIGDRS